MTTRTVKRQIVSSNLGRIVFLFLQFGVLTQQVQPTQIGITIAELCEGFYVASCPRIELLLQKQYQLICVGCSCCVWSPNCKKRNDSTKIRTHDLSLNSPRCQPLHHHHLLYTIRILNVCQSM